MEQPIVIRENIDHYMQELTQWLGETESEPLEHMTDFFTARIDSYEAHMALWRDAYRYMASILPEDAKTVLDLGCGTGLEIDEIMAARPGISITGIDLSEAMLEKLYQKHPSVQTFCADYFTYDLGLSEYDVVLSFETLHHFKPEKKQGLFQKIYRALKPGGVYLEADYLACCEGEERLLMQTADRKRKRDGIPDDVFVHFDTPLTAEREMSLMTAAGFHPVQLIRCIQGACFIRADKKA